MLLNSGSGVSRPLYDMYSPAIFLFLLLRLLADPDSSAPSDSVGEWAGFVPIMIGIWVLYGIVRESRRADMRRKWGVSKPTIDQIIATGDFVQAQRILENDLNRLQRWKGKNSVEVRQKLMQIGRLQVQAGDYDDAEATFFRALTVEEASVGPDSLDLVSTLHWIARSRYERKDFAGSLELWDRIIALRKQHLAADHPDIAFSLNEKGKLLSLLAREDDAEAAIREAVVICERSDKPELFANVLRTLGWTLRRKNQLDDAEAAFRRSLALLQSSRAEPALLAERCSELAGVLHAKQDLPAAQTEALDALDFAEAAFKDEPAKLLPYLDTVGSMAYEQENYPEAESYLRRLVALQDETFGNHNAVVPVSMENLSLVLRLQKKFAEAEELQRKALAIKEEVLGAEDDHLAGSVENLALCLIAQEKFADAEPLLRRSLSLQERAAQPETPHMAVTLYNLAYVLKRTGDPSGEPLLWRALNIEERALGAQNPRLAVTLDALAHTRLATGDAAGAETLFRQALEIQEKVEGASHANVLPMLRSLALLLRTRRSFGECEQLMRRALIVVESTFGARSREVATASFDLANLLHETGNLAEAESLYRRAISIYDLDPANNGPGAAISTGALASLVERTGDYLGAKLLYESAVAKAAKSLGVDHPNTLQMKQRLDTLMLRLADPHIN